jgi:hypothetical protein
MDDSVVDYDLINDLDSFGTSGTKMVTRAKAVNAPVSSTIAEIKPAKLEKAAEQEVSIEQIGRRRPMQQQKLLLELQPVAEVEATSGGGALKRSRPSLDTDDSETTKETKPRAKKQASVKAKKEKKVYDEDDDDNYSEYEDDSDENLVMADDDESSSEGEDYKSYGENDQKSVNKAKSETHSQGNPASPSSSKNPASPSMSIESLIQEPDDPFHMPSLAETFKPKVIPLEKVVVATPSPVVTLTLPLATSAPVAAAATSQSSMRHNQKEEMSSIGSQKLNLFDLISKTQEQLFKYQGAGEKSANTPGSLAHGNSPPKGI